MAKGDDALRKKRNKIIRKRLRNSESSVTARVASIIAAKNRRKVGKRRICEGMCFSLPTEDDPFNERHEKKAIKKSKKSKKQKLDSRDKKLRQMSVRVSNAEEKLLNKPTEKTKSNLNVSSSENVSVSKFLVLCLKAIEDAWVEEDTFNKGTAGGLLSNLWGVNFWEACSAGSSVVEVSEAFATRNQVAWLVSTAADIIARKKKQGNVAASPFLLFLVSSKDRAVEVRSLCKPLKALGVHTVSLHPGTSLDHQIHGLKNCEPEFLVSTPERLLELVSLNAADISGASLLVLDGLTKFNDLGLLDSLKSIKERISGDPQIITFSQSYREDSVTLLLHHLVRGSVYRLSAYHSIASLSFSVSQCIHFYTSEVEKFSELIQIISEAHNPKVQSSKVLLVSGSTCKMDPLVSCLNSKGYAICGDSHTSGLNKTNGEKPVTVLVNDIINIRDLDMDKFEVVILVDFPSAIEDYISILMKIARHTLAGELHSFFSTADSLLAQPLIVLLEQCGQKVPDLLRSFCSSNPTIPRQTTPTRNKVGSVQGLV